MKKDHVCTGPPKMEPQRSGSCPQNVLKKGGLVIWASEGAR